ncbi:MAG: hypothetical protein PT120_00670 [Aphanizomenon gracile PMC649.10]|nr:hypothetical protein [Dolichospermum sp. LEGE 00240]MDM3853459.1 hypothetical protein [Aphanizomenon gracile PMC649.10]MDM3862622.1 hypothetical protein [Aphanizomenon gracile PMC644.10]
MPINRLCDRITDFNPTEGDHPYFRIVNWDIERSHHIASSLWQT